jgi:hypothetical protein
MATLRRARLVARRRERDVLWEALRRAWDRRRAEVVVLTGPEGMGKTALAQWFAERVLEVGAAEVLDAGPGTDGQRGLPALVHRALRLDGLTAEAAGDRVRARFPDVSDAIAVDLGILGVEHGVALQGSERVASVLALVTKIAEERPVVVRLAPDRPPDRDQIALAAALGSRDAPIVVVSEGGDPHDPAFATATHVVLDRLSDDDLGAVVDARLPLAPQLRSRVVAVAKGRPDAAVRCIADLLARDVLVATAAGCALRVEAALLGEPKVRS